MKKQPIRDSLSESGSIELVVLGLIAALIVVLAIPLIDGLPPKAEKEKPMPSEALPNQSLPAQSKDKPATQKS